MAIKPLSGDALIFQEFAGFSEDKPNIFTKMKLDRMAVNGLGDLMPDTIDMPFGVKFPLRSRSEYEFSFTMQAEPVVFDKLDALITDGMRRMAELERIAVLHPAMYQSFIKMWNNRYCHPGGGISGKGVRRTMADIRHNTIRGEDPQRFVVTHLVSANIGRMSPNKIARLIRRQFARAAKRPELKPDFAALRNTEGKDLDAVFSGQDES